jgi:hypothetical protein
VKISVERAIEILLAVIACIAVGNAIAYTFLNSTSLVPPDMYTPATVFGACWLLFLWAEPKRLT